tara:strand:- start:970 stop:2601 length:1632 start_codon:yes stop_codon:yes gene_type:complete
MVLKNSLNYINEFFFYITSRIRKIYLKSSLYNKKISKINNNSLYYKPSLKILSCLIKYDKKKYNVEDFYLNSIWKNEKINENDYKKLHSFFWLFTLDLKSSKKLTQSIILNWIDNNENFNQKNWEIDILSKRIISWISNSKLVYEESSDQYKDKFNFIINKQINHLINEINRSELFNNKMLGCTAIILSGLSYNDQKILNYGLNLLKEINKFNFDTEGFPKSRNLRQLTFYLKHFILIRELLKESQNEIPTYLDESIFYLGQAYNYIWQSAKLNFLFNGNHEADHSDFDKYLKAHGYKFKNINGNEVGGYSCLKNKNISLIIDVGSSPDKKFSQNYQSGPLSFEMFYSGNKIITNSGFFQNYKHQLNSISKSTAAHSTLIIDNNSVNKFKKQNNADTVVDDSFKIFDKKIIIEKSNWKISASHDGYQKKYGIIHKRELEYLIDNNTLTGKDFLLKRKNFKNCNFEIRFHLYPNTKVTKTQDKNVVLIELENSGWKFSCKHYAIDIETGLFFGRKNNYVENQNIFISGITQNNDQEILWEIKKI